MSDGEFALRRLFLVLYDSGIQFAVWFDNLGSITVLGLFEQAITALDAQHDGESDHITVPAAECSFYDWEFRPLTVGTTVAQVPEPGVVFAIGRRQGAEDDGIGLRLAILSSLSTDETYGPRIERFLRSPDAVREAAPLLRYEAFISHAALDAPFAARFVEALRRDGVSSFLAEVSLSAGRLWSDELRAGLLSSRTGVVLLTPHSVGSAWVHAEVGAIWALRRPVLPVLVGLAPEEVPASLTDLMPTCVAVSQSDHHGAGLAEELAARLATTLSTLDAAEPHGA